MRRFRELILPNLRGNGLTAKVTFPSGRRDEASDEETLDGIKAARALNT